MQTRSLQAPLAFFAALLLGVPLLAQASYLPGETLDPSCLPTDSTCIVTSLTASSTATSFPYYAANGSVLSATSTLTLLTNGNFGIGTTSPWAKLSVTGNSDLGNYALAGYFTATTTATSTFIGGIQLKALNVTSTTASSTFANGINLSAGCFAVNDTCVGGSALSGGAASKVAFWTDASTLSNNTNFHWDDSNARLGIGTTSPYAKLSVVGETVSSYFTATSTTANNFSGSLGSVLIPTYSFTVDSDTGIYSSSANFVDIATGGGVRLTVGSTITVGSGVAFRAAAGNASTPGLQERVDTNTGIFWPVADSLGFTTGGVEKVRIDSSGNLGIGTTSPYSRLTVWGTDTASTSPFTVANSASTTVFAVYNNGNATYSGLIFQSSDQRLKTNITPLDASSSLASILALTPVSYTRLDQSDLGTNQGFIAQDVQQIFPDLVSTSSPTSLTPDGTLTLNYVGLIAPIVEALKALAGEVRDLARSVTTVVVNATTGNFTNVNTDNLCVKKSDGSNLCITGDQLGSLLDKQETPPASAPPPLPPPELPADTPPVVVAEVDVPATSTVTIIPGGPDVSDISPPDSSVSATVDTTSSVDSSSSSDPSSDTIVPTDSPTSATPSDY